MTTTINTISLSIFPVIIENGKADDGLYFSIGQLNGLGGLNVPHKQVLKSAAGYYIGYLSQADWSDEIFWEPYSRDSECYWDTREEAEQALISGKYPVKF